MTSRLVVLNQITLCADGSVGVQLLKRIVEDDKILFEEPHRILVMPDETIDAVIERDNINGHLAALGFPEIDPEAVKRSNASAKQHRKYPDIAARVEEFANYRMMETARAEAEAEEQERQAAIDAAAKEKQRIADEAAQQEEAAKEQEAEAAAAAAAAQKAKDDQEKLAKFIADEVARQVAEAKAAG